jgi:hypothetical protein
MGIYYKHIQCKPGGRYAVAFFWAVESIMALQLRRPRIPSVTRVSTDRSSASSVVDK